MGEVNLAIHGKSYGVACDDGQESRVSELGKYVDSRLREIAMAGAASNESHLLVLTAVVLADEIQELRDALKNFGPVANGNRVSVRERVTEQDEQQIVEAIEHLAGRIDSVAARLKKIA